MTDEEWNRDPRTVAHRKETVAMIHEYLARLEAAERNMARLALKLKAANEREAVAP